MSAELFKAVIEGLCNIYKLDPAPVLEGCTLEMDGVNFSLVHHKESDSPLLTLYCDFGAVPSELEAQVYRKLLEANLTSYTGQGETFCMAPDGRVIFANNYPLAVLTPEMLAGNMALVSIFAKSWREGYFLNPEKPVAEQPKKKSHSELLMKQAGKAPK